MNGGNTILVHNGLVCNEDETFRGYLLIRGDRIEKVGRGDFAGGRCDRVIDAGGGLIMPGVIDDQVHFREPGLTPKGDIRSESRAAVAGGVTSFMDMPNTVPPAVTLDLLEEKYARAAEVSSANYSFYLGATNGNMDEIARVDPEKICGIKVFMGSSTGNMLVDDQSALAAIFESSPVIVTVHCEEESVVRANMEAALREYGGDVPVAMHPVIRNAEACYRSSAKAVELADRYGARLHILHLSTAKELDLFDRRPLAEKRITAEVCVHHLWFTGEDYPAKGNLIKWNPAIKSPSDRDALREGVRDDRIDVVATDHAPHTLEEKMRPYLKAPSGAPMVQHSLTAMLEMADRGIFTVGQVCRKMCHAPAELFGIERRGYLREGYYADVAVVEAGEPWEVTQGNILYKCCWSPLGGERFRWRVTHTVVNGQVAWADGRIDENVRGRRLAFSHR